MLLLPIEDVTRPAVLAGQSNGALSASILVDTPGQGGGPVVRLVAPAARAWRALCAAARVAGYTFRATSRYDSYRPYAVQEATFRARYQTTPIAGAPTRRWLGQTWYQKPDTAAAAVPGTSNHGWALAIDIAEERDGDVAPESITTGAVAWLVAGAGRYGFSAELQSEPWHWRYFAGDAIPAAVLAHEGDDEMDEATRRAWDARILAGLSGQDARWTHTDGRAMVDTNTVGREIASLKTAVANLTPPELTDAQLDALADKVADRLRSLRFDAAQ